MTPIVDGAVKSGKVCPRFSIFDCEWVSVDDELAVDGCRCLV
jgi:hypothetical protein